MPIAIGKLLTGMSNLLKNWFLRRNHKDKLVKHVDIEQCDRLSKNAVLPLICTYIDPYTLHQCLKVCRNFNYTITKYWFHMRKVPINLAIRYKLARAENHRHMKVEDCAIIRIECKFMGIQVIRITNSSVSIDYSTIPPFWKQFFRKHGGFLLMKKSDIWAGFRIDMIRFPVKSIDTGLTLVLSRMLEVVQINKLSLDGASSDVILSLRNCETVSRCFRDHYYGREASVIFLHIVKSANVDLANMIGARRLKLFFRDPQVYIPSSLDTSDVELVNDPNNKDIVLVRTFLYEWQTGTRDIKAVWFKFPSKIDFSDKLEGLIIEPTSYGSIRSLKVLKRKRDNQWIVIDTGKSIFATYFPNEKEIIFNYLIEKRLEEKWKLRKQSRCKSIILA